MYRISASIPDTNWVNINFIDTVLNLEDQDSLFFVLSGGSGWADVGAHDSIWLRYLG
ncbi:MAG: hypothetical protein ABIJ40_03810 [Bacteroidota bacterium]